MSPVGAADTSSSHWTARLVRAGQVATALTAIIGVIILVVDRLSKDKQETDVLSATLSRPTIDRPVRLNAFLAAHNRLRSYTGALREQDVDAASIRQIVHTPGVEIHYQLALRGAAGMRVGLTPTVYTRTRRLAAATIPFAGTEYYVLEARSQTTSDSTWTPYPLRAGTYYVEVVVRLARRSSDNDILAVRRSKVFTVSHGE